MSGESLFPRCPERTPHGRQCIHDKGHMGDHFAKDEASYFIWPTTRLESLFASRRDASGSSVGEGERTE